jgi:hypothetical protein
VPALRLGHSKNSLKEWVEGPRPLAVNATCGIGRPECQKSNVALLSNVVT